MIEFGIKPPYSWLAIGSVLLLIILYWSYTLSPGRPKGFTRLVLVFLRTVAVLLGVLCLLDPQWVEKIEHQQKSRIAVMLDTSRSMSVRDQNGERLAAARNWINKEITPQIPKHLTPVYITFDQTPQLAGDVLEASSRPFDTASATGGATAIARAIETITTLSGSDPIAGVVLCSDGIETEQQDLLAAARLCRRKGIPIHSATFGSTNEMRDIVIENIQVKRAVSAQAPTKVIVTVNSSGYDGLTLPLQVRLGQQLLTNKTITLQGQQQRVELDIKPSTRGYRVFNVYVPNQAGEWLVSNNRRSFGLEVVESNIRVIYMEGTPSQSDASQPEWMYLKTALESDPQIKVKVLYGARGRPSQFDNVVDADPNSDDGIYPVVHSTRGYPKTLSELLRYDVVIHSDITKESFTSQQLEITARLVEEHGGGFVMIGGKSAFGAGGYHRTILDKFIPVAMETSSDVSNQPFKMTVPANMWNHPLIALGVNLAANQIIWGPKFPYLYGFNRVGRAKPGAVVLGVNPSVNVAGGPAIVMAAQEVGKGRTMAFTSDITRTWGRDYETQWGEPIQSGLGNYEHNCDMRYYRAFWINAVRWLAANKLGQTNQLVTLELPQTVGRPGENITASIRVLDKNLSPQSAAVTSVILTSSDGESRVFPAIYNSAMRVYQTRFQLPGEGDYAVTATASLGREKLGDDKQLLVSETVDTEMLDVRARPDVMASFARISGGKNLEPMLKSQVTSSELFGKEPPVTREFRRHSLWDKWYVLITLVTILCCEWILRRLRGMA